MSDDEQPKDTAVADETLVQIAGLLLDAADSTSDARLQKLATLALEMVQETDAVRALLKAHAKQATQPDRRQPLQTIGVGGRKNKYSDALETIQQILQQANE